jgi:Glyoxalase/Bleomycin resistance protein/Dioxygenase superfamily
MFVTGLVSLYTRDIEAGLHFYRDLLGFTETFRTPAEGIPGHVELQLNGFRVGLGPVGRQQGCTALRPRPAARPWSWWCGPTISTTPTWNWRPRGRLCSSRRTTPAATTGMRCAIRTEIWWRSSPRFPERSGDDTGEGDPGGVIVAADKASQLADNHALAEPGHRCEHPPSPGYHHGVTAVSGPLGAAGRAVVPGEAACIRLRGTNRRGGYHTMTVDLVRCR